MIARTPSLPATALVPDSSDLEFGDPFLVSPVPGDMLDQLIVPERMEGLASLGIGAARRGHGEAPSRSPGASVAEALVHAMEAKDPYLRGHSYRVADIASSIASALGLDDQTVDDVRLAGRLHDVGMIGVRESVLNKVGPLDPAEILHVRQHVAIGVEILSPIPDLGSVLQYVHDHHERVDGGGYPWGLAGTAISLGGRIVAVADAFDALTSPRAYREPMTQLQCLAHLARQSGTAFDPMVWDALYRVVTEGRLLPFMDVT